MPETRLLSWEAKVIGSLGAIIVTLAILWINNIVDAIADIRREHKVIEDKLVSGYVSKETVTFITTARDRQLAVMVTHIEKNTDRIQYLEDKITSMREEIAKLKADYSDSPIDRGRQQ